MFVPLCFGGVWQPKRSLVSEVARCFSCFLCVQFSSTVYVPGQPVHHPRMACTQPRTS